MKLSDIIKYIMKIMWRDFKKNSFKSFQRYSKKALKVQILDELSLGKVVKNGLVFKIARTKIGQNFLALKYHIKQHSDVT